MSDDQTPPTIGYPGPECVEGSDQEALARWLYVRSGGKFWAGETTWKDRHRAEAAQWCAYADLLTEVEKFRSAETVLRTKVTALQRQWRNRSEEHLANAKNRIDAGMGGAYSFTSEALLRVLKETAPTSDGDLP